MMTEIGIKLLTISEFNLIFVYGWYSVSMIQTTHMHVITTNRDWMFHIKFDS